MTIIDLAELVSAMTQPDRKSTEPPVPDAEVHLVLPDGASVAFLAEKNTVVVRWGEPERRHYEQMRSDYLITRWSKPEGEEA